ncbi:hypothetical protein SALBM311S_02679 [Streptomyces alboniger]
MTVLDARALNRATLARQHLLKRSDTSVSEAVAHLCGLQAQDPQEPFTGLWSRLSGFKPEQLDDALTGRAVVRTHLMRRTVHLVTADDALTWRARHDTMLRQRVLGTYRRELAGIDVDEVAAAGRAVMADQQPRTMTELVQALEDRWPGPPRRVLGELLVAALIPMAQLPPRGLWHQTAGVRNLPLSTWLERDIAPLPADGSDPVGQQLLHRYLAAYGPAASTDLRAWCGLAGLPAAIKAAREELVVFRDERGRELLDLPDAPRPTPTPPPPSGSSRPSTTPSSATTTVAASSTPPTSVCPSQATAPSLSTDASPPPGPCATTNSTSAPCAPSPPWNRKPFAPKPRT